MAAVASPSRLKLFPRDLVTWLLIAGLLLFRFPITFIMTFVPSLSAWAFPCIEVGSYLLVALLIVWERERLSASNIDWLALGLLLAKPCELLFYRGRGGDFSNPALLLYIPISVGLAITLVVARPTLKRLSLINAAWLAGGIAAGILMGLGVGYVLGHFQYPVDGGSGQKTIGEIFSTPKLKTQFLSFLVGNPIQQMFYAGGMEEPIFRGFLWGALRRGKWKDGWICLFQAGLFCLGHIYYIPARLFWSLGITFAAGLVFGLLAWRSRSIATSLLAHGLTNGWGSIFASLVRW